METVQDTDVQETKPGRVRLFIGQLSWRIILIRLVVNGLTLIVVAVFVPNIYFVDRSFVSVLLMAVALGILNAFVKPIFQFLTLPFIFATYGFVIILINTIILLLMAAIFDQRFFVGGLVWAIIGGLLMGIIASFLESLLGLNLPIVPKTQEADGSPATGSRTITDLLVSEVAGDEVEQQAPSEDVTEPKGAEDSGEPPAPAIADSGENNSAPTDDEQLVATEGQDLVETQDEADDVRQGDEG